MARTMPAIFFGHGNPMNALLQNSYTGAWKAIGLSIPRPKAIVCISAHWYVPGTSVTISDMPRTIHDFGGFPEELYQVKYPAAGDPELARRIQEMLAPIPVKPDESWGLDHGTWSVLRHVYPNADVPIVQLSINGVQPASFHFEIGRRLAPLRREEILVVGSGNVVHNLRKYAWGGDMPEPYDWALRFEQRVKELIVKDQYEPLIDYESLGRDAAFSIPTPDHYLPLLYVIATRQRSEAVSFPVEGVDGGSISMLTVQIGER
jgi:4,5-DOPA dioxygenase extradiol